MARALSHDVRLIVMDEPSAALDPDEVDNLFRIVGDLTADGVAVVYISHRLEEIRRIGDRVTVLKDGRAAAGGLPAKYHADPRDRRPDDRPRTSSTSSPSGPPRAATPRQHARAAASKGSPGTGEFAPLDLELRARRDRRPRRARRLRPLRDPGDRLRRPQAHRRPGPRRRAAAAPRQRPRRRTRRARARPRGAQGAGAADAGVRHPQCLRLLPVPLLPRRLARPRAPSGPRPGPPPANCRCAPTTPTAPVRTLSGGNQQKAVLARWLLRGCRVLLLDEPTRGVDVGARAELYAVIRRLADEGLAVLLVSSEVPEVLGLADRVLVLREGRVVHTARRPGARRTPRARPRMEGSPTCMTQPGGADARPADAEAQTTAATPSPPTPQEQRAPPPAAPAGPRRSRRLAPTSATSPCSASSPPWSSSAASPSPTSSSTPSNLQLVLTQASVIGVVTVGMTFVIIGGGIDLSVGAIVALASVWATTVATQEYGFGGILFTAVLVGLGCGLVNGLLIAYGGDGAVHRHPRHARLGPRPRPPDHRRQDADRHRRAGPGPRRSATPTSSASRRWCWSSRPSPSSAGWC